VNHALNIIGGRHGVCAAFRCLQCLLLNIVGGAKNRKGIAMKLRFVINDVWRAQCEYQHTGIMPMVDRRCIELDLTPEQASQVTLRELGKDCGRPFYEEIESVTVVNALQENKEAQTQQAGDCVVNFLPCPFCGSNDIEVREGIEFWCTCKNCYAEGPTARDFDGDAIAEWNKRNG
jgi:Lar family restriction alleviation protein